MDLGKAARDPWVWGQLALLATIGVAAPWLRPDTPARGVQILGAAVIGLGLLVFLSALTYLGPNLTPGTEPLPGASLVTRGPYRVIRHPIYTGVITLVTGYTLAWGNAVAALGVFLVATAYFEGKARAEERWLVRRMPGYEDYRRAVPRLFPGGWK